MPPSIAKRQLRAELLAERNARGAAALSLGSAAITEHLLAWPALAAARTVAAYASLGNEPATETLRAALRSRGVRLMLPCLDGDDDLDWALDIGTALVAGRHGTLEPAGPRLGRTAPAQADVVVVPALAVAADGTRLGRGGGSYDRALARVPHAVSIVALVYRGEVLDRLPSSGHDQSVTAAATPDGVRLLACS